MDALRFYGLRRAEAPRRWELPVVPQLCSGLGALFGGCALGAVVETLEQETGRPLVWATGQYLTYAFPPSVLDIDVTLAVEGRSITQARAVGTVDGQEILAVNAALGRRDSEHRGQWATMPAVPPPEECAPRRMHFRHEGTIRERLDDRLADARSVDELPGPPGTGHASLWSRIPDMPVTASALAIVGDFVPFGVGQSLGLRAGGNSLDNTLRVVQLVETDWILVDVHVHAVHHGFAHGRVHLWAEDGTLLATASQSTIVRPWREEGSAPHEGRSARNESG